MNQHPMQMKDPAVGVPAQLLPHVHLVSKHRYPVSNNPSIETLVAYLMEAAKIMRDLQPVQWQFLDAPQDGTILLTWQPSDHLGTNFASDGYVWADAEQTIRTDVRGYVLEVFTHRAGYRPGEPVASHSRRRYRLLPGNPNLGLPVPDVNLYIIHYGKASPRESVPTASIPLLPLVNAQMQQRRMIQAQGQLPRKDFMLHDRSTWTTLTLPVPIARQGQPGMPGPGHRRGNSMGESTLEEEEDVSRGDILDFMTPRDVSRLRYEQHHEWMEEILESPYPTLSIIPSDLGLGRKGELEPLTMGFFDAPTSASQDPSSNGPRKAGRMDPGKAEEFINKANAKIAEMQADLERMKERHASRMATLQKTTILNTAEKKLRNAPINEDKSAGAETIDEIVETVEGKIGRKVERVANVTCVTRGGLQDRFSLISGSSSLGSITSPTKAVGASLKEQTAPGNDVQEANVAPPQPHQPQQDSITSHEDGASRTAIPSEPDQQIETQDEVDQQDAGENQDSDLPTFDDIGADVDMAGMEDDQGEVAGEQQGDDWVMVGEEGNSTGLEEARETLNSGGQQETTLDAAPEENTAQITNTDMPEAGQEESALPPDADDGFDTGDFDIGNEFDTAGDALASYEDGNDQTEVNLDSMEDSAFGEAFQSHEDDANIS